SFGSLGYAVVRAYQTTGSFNLQLSEQDLLADLQTSHNRLQAYTIQVQQLAQAALQANATLSIRETLDVLTHCARNIVGAHQSVTSLTQGGDWSQAIQSISLSDKYDAWQSYAALPTGEGIYTEVCRQN